MKKINILFIINKLVIGGAEHQLIELAKRINKDKYNIVVGCLYDSKELHGNYRGIYGIEKVCFYRKHKYDFFFFLKLLKFLIDNRIDIIQLYLTPSKFFGMVAALVCRIPVKIIAERGTEFPHPTIGNLFYVNFERFLMKFANVIVVNSEAGKRFIRKKGIESSKLSVIYNGIDPERISLNRNSMDVRKEFSIEEDSPIIGIIATLTPKKDHYTFLKSAKEIIERFPSVKFLIVGDGPLRPKLEHLADELGLNSNAIFAGNRSDVATLISIFDIAVLSSKHTEGCSNFILEAMGMRKPVVATDVGGNEELVVDGVTGKIVPKTDCASLAEAIIWMLRNPAASKELGENGYERVRKYFGVERMVKKYEAIYESLLERRKGLC